LTKGFFIVRQKRIPTILAQSVGIATTQNGNLPVIKIKDNYIIDSFLKKDSQGKPMLGNSSVKLSNSKVINNALLCPEADLRSDLYNTYFNSSEYTLLESNYQTPMVDGSRHFNKSIINNNQYVLGDPTSSNTNKLEINTGVLLIEPGIELIRNNKYNFSSKSGDAIIPYSATDVHYGDYANPMNNIPSMQEYSLSTNKVRGIFNTYLGIDYKNIKQGTYYNIYQKEYDFEKY